MRKIKKLLSRVPFLYSFARSVRDVVRERDLYKRTRAALIHAAKSGKSRIFYLGIPAHTNLGDLAQGVCIRRWLKKHYPEYLVVEIETNALVNTKHSCLALLKSTYRRGDFIVYQSGYTTTDLGGFADEMHRAVIDILPKAPMLMLPQTIFFKNPGNRQRTSQSYNSAKSMLFLARDRVSYDMAKEMFPDLCIKLYPDIVTTLIGTYDATNTRDGILFCCRNDSEKFYTDEEIQSLMERCASLCAVQKTDTTKKESAKTVVAHAGEYIEKEIDTYAKYRLIITDRYHGTILSLVAGTPVIIIKTTDHKVTTGAEWFSGVYDDMVFLANDLDEAYSLVEELLSREKLPVPVPYFENEYYDKLPAYFSDFLNERKENADL